MAHTLVDSHAHLEMEEFDEDRDLVVQRAFREGINSILCLADVTNPKSIKKTFDLTEKYESLIAAAGVHPHQAKHFTPSHAQRIEKLAVEKKIKAVGEIGLDFHYNFSPRLEQEEVFRRQLNLAQKLGLPVVVHSRNSSKEAAQAIEQERFSKGGVLHCFSEDWTLAKQMMDLDFFISFSGILTFPKAQPLREIAEKIPLGKLLVETDSPYLVPFSLKSEKKRNEPAHVIETAKVLAGIKKVSLDKLACATSQNFESLFMFEIKNPRC
ncbi:MAG: YchF/TatD family DNA exonuclease [Candidatus Aminicenantes bacterium]|nr:YchF/TatD family DNA exonuclease [Candidatus Aminicenantes bacterium]